MQQFRQMQQVGQGPFAVQALAEPGGYMKIHQQVAQHGQHALGLPLLAIAVKLLHGFFPAHFILIEGIQFRVGQVQDGAGQGAAYPGVGFRSGAGVQDQQQVVRFGLGKHGVLIGQIDAAYLAFHQRIADGFGFGAIAYQDGNIVGVQGPEAVGFPEAGDAFYGTVKQMGNFTGATCRLLIAVLAGAHRFFLLVHPQGNAGFFVVVD